MTKTEKIWLSISVIVALIGLLVLAINHFFSIEVHSTGEAYGFHIGDNREKTYQNALKLLKQSEITAIHTWPEKGFHWPFTNTENPQQNIDPKWVMIVDPGWWNNTITITFEDNEVVEIRRDRIISELP